MRYVAAVSEERPAGTRRRQRTRARYFREVHTELVTALVVICVALDIVGWKLHPGSDGFDAVPQSVTILVSGTHFTATETLTQTSDGGAIFHISQLGGAHYAPLTNSTAVTLIAGPTAAGALAVSTAPVAKLDSKAIPDESWTFIVLNRGDAQPCDSAKRYRSGTVSLPMQKTLPALVVAPPPPPPSEDTGGTWRPRRCACGGPVPLPSA
jgi:hypothetical protein